MKRTGRDHDGRVIILPPTTADEHIAVQRESKARTTLLQSIPDDRSLKLVMLENLLSWVSLLSENELGWDDSAFSVFTTNSEDVEGRPIFIVTSLQRSTQMTLPPVILVSNLWSTSQLILTPVHQLPVGTHLIKDCDFYDKQMANKTVGIGVGPAYNRNKVNHQNQFVPQAVFLRTGKVNILPARPQPVPTGKTKVFAPVLTDRGYSPSVSSGIYGQLLLSPQQVVLRKHIEKVYIGYPRTIVDLIHLHTDDNVADLLTKSLDGLRYVVPTGRVIVPTGRYIVPTGRVIVATGEYVVPAGKCYS
nr:ribonuclease H-like domain, reverse transcriptase, RNA-dependent DNA polymerase [Tanacetum cinerariifolium]